MSTSTDRNAEMFDLRDKDKDWLNPFSMSSLKRAVKDKKKTVILNGNEFSITYGIYFKATILEPRESVMLKRTDGEFVPFGYIPIIRIQEFVFEADHD
jgi:hypothetical protein